MRNCCIYRLFFGIFRCLKSFGDFHANLKKVLALVLAFACAFTMFAGAAFTDSADIKVKSEVVNTLVSLGVVNGYDDGSFKPNGTVTRAEMAKMIYVLRTGNSDASAYNDDKTSFTDIGSHWARGYIKYCQSLGIIAGKSNTKFCPNDKVTAQEAAKMLLVTLGYDATKAGLTGAGWASKTNALADENGLLKDVTTSFTAACPRQYAAQLIYNAIFAPTVVWRDDAYTNVTLLGTDNKTVGEKYMGLKTSVAVLKGVTKETNKSTYKLSLDAPTTEQLNDSTIISGSIANNTAKIQQSFTKIAKDYSALTNRVVKVLYKNSDEVYGVYATDDSSVLNGVVGDYKISGGKVKFDGTKYAIKSGAANVKVDTDASNATTYAISTYLKDDTTVGAANKGLNKASDAKAILEDDEVKSFEVTSYMVGKVSYVGKDYVNVTNKAASADPSKFSGYTKLDKDSCNSDISGLKKDDYVIITNSKVNGKLDAVKADTVEGKITSTRDSGNDVRIDGNWYTSALDDNADIALSNTVNVVLKNGYIVCVDDVKIGSTDVALMIEADINSGVGKKWQADMLFPDGTRKVVEIDTDESTATTTLKSSAPVLVTYEQSGSKYILKTIVKNTTTNKYAGYDQHIDGTSFTKWHVKDGKILGDDNGFQSYINDSATIFLKYGSDDYKVVTGSAMKKWGESYKFSADLLADNSNGYPYAKVGFINSTDSKNPTGSDKTYAYIFGVENNAKDADNNEYVEYNVWNGSEMTTLKVKQSASNFYKEGTVVEYTLDTDGYADCTLYTIANGKLKKGALTKFAWTKGQDGSVAFSGGTGSYDIDKDDTKVLFVNTKDEDGAVDGELQEAAPATGSGYINNALYIVGSGNTLDLLIVDLGNELDTDVFPNP